MITINKKIMGGTFTQLPNGISNNYFYVNEDNFKYSKSFNKNGMTLHTKSDGLLDLCQDNYSIGLRYNHDEGGNSIYLRSDGLPYVINSYYRKTLKLSDCLWTKDVEFSQLHLEKFKPFQFSGTSPVIDKYTGTIIMPIKMYQKIKRSISNNDQ